MCVSGSLQLQCPLTYPREVHAWSWSFAKLVNKIDFAVFGAKVPQYSNILEYDRMVRDFPIPFNLRPNCGQHCGEPPDLPPTLFMQRYLTLLEKELSECPLVMGTFCTPLMATHFSALESA